MKIKIVYFAYLKPGFWEPIFLEQLLQLKNCGLYDLADNVYISLSCNNDDLKRAKQLIWAKFKKVQIINLFSDNLYEYPGIKAVYDISLGEDSVILYFHTKGMTSGEKNNGNHTLRKILFKNVIENFNLYLDEFKKNDTLDVGTILPSEFGFAWYNFFWVRSGYVQKYCIPPEFTSHRYYWERWLGNEHSTKKNIVTYSPFLGYNKLKNRADLNNKRSIIFKQTEL
jgi:hypothetical protein